MSEQHQGHDPTLMALRKGYNTYVRKFLGTPSRLHPTAFAYDRGVIEGMRWCIETYEEMSNR